VHVAIRVERRAHAEPRIVVAGDLDAEGSDERNFEQPFRLELAAERVEIRHAASIAWRLSLARSWGTLAAGAHT
jgi:hypothetical protein